MDVDAHAYLLCFPPLMRIPARYTYTLLPNNRPNNCIILPSLEFHKMSDGKPKESPDGGASETDAQGEKIELDYDKVTEKGEICVKVICLGDSAVGKSK